MQYCIAGTVYIKILTDNMQSEIHLKPYNYYNYIIILLHFQTLRVLMASQNKIACRYLFQYTFIISRSLPDCKSYTDSKVSAYLAHSQRLFTIVPNFYCICSRICDLAFNLLLYNYVYPIKKSGLGLLELTSIYGIARWPHFRVSFAILI